MGVKLRNTINPLEASVSNGNLNIYFYDTVIKSVALGIPSNITIERQCNFFSTTMNNLIAYLYSDKYVIIIRTDGTLDIFTKDYILLKSTHVNIDTILDKELVIYSSGSLMIKSDVKPAYLAITSDNYSFIFSPQIAATILLDNKDDLNIKIIEWAKLYNDVGTMHIYDNSTQATRLWVNFGSSQDSMLNSFKLLTSEGFIGGIA